MTYEKGMVRSELFWNEKIRENTYIKVPEISFHDFSGTFIFSDYFIMEKIPGKPMNQTDFSSEEKAEAVRVLA